MTLAEIKHVLTEKKLITFELPNGDLVPSHFHVTEIGKIEKKFIDCGGVFREESKASFQLWEADDYNHRLHPEKLVEIINLSEEVLNLEENAIIEVEYQAETIGKYDLEYDGNHFLLVNKFTSCLAEDQCGITEKPKRSLKELSTRATTDCKPGSGCC
ncbi:DUF6428 family protein [Zunongwangia endophytica]|uniref:DUF6428 family protein n=1 Tax=Zunongwangia endophytica TaxID=1808945 RepID=A0ABV8H8M4_9FLAO|nr:DUF6428 family protein [Zunongwangia endophytica]MDN3595392.1 DUF6428 family protein [Zunongwangia endophytica]